MIAQGSPLNALTVVINYGLSVEDAVKAGKYDWSNSDISTKHFPSKRKGTAEVEIILLHFNRDMYSGDMFRELDKQGGLRPAELHEGLVVGAKYPDIQRKFPVVVLGSVWRDPYGYRYCAFLYGNGSGRFLGLSPLGWWDDFCRFAAVCK